MGLSLLPHAFFTTESTDSTCGVHPGYVLKGLEDTATAAHSIVQLSKAPKMLAHQTTFLDSPVKTLGS